MDKWWKRSPPTALGQAFYLSPMFSRLRIETRDYRSHPVLGGISSTRWGAYERFERRHASLAYQLKDQPVASSAIQLIGRRARVIPALSSPEVYGIKAVAARHGRLKKPGVIAGHRGRNRLAGSRGDDVLMGFAGRDVLIGGKGSDLLSGGTGADRFRFRKVDRRGQGVDTDTVVDFNPDEGDRIKINGVRHDVGMDGFSGRSGELQAMVWMAGMLPESEGRVPSWMIQGVMLAVDDDGDKRADAFIQLPGLGEWRKEWLVSQGM